MIRHRVQRAVIGAGVASVLLALSSAPAFAVPSFARQTGAQCSACHTVFPELKPYGRIFKLNGYTLSKSSTAYEFPPPIAGMAQLSYTRTDKLQPRGSITENWATHPLVKDNDTLNVPQQLSLFYAGRIYGKLGAFVQGTYDGTGNTFFLDNASLRYAQGVTVAEKSLLLGVTLNNNPTVQDVWNSTPAWGFPFASSSVAPTPAASTVIDGGLAQQVGGLGVYAFWNNLVYAEVAVYGTARNGILAPLGAGTPNDTIVKNAVPYWRVAVQQNWEDHYVALGTYGLQANIFPGGTTLEPTDRFTDVALDAQYQYLGETHMVTAQATWIHEWQARDASFAGGNAARLSDRLDTMRVSLHYYNKSRWGQIGGSVGFFATTGSADTLLYAPGDVTGSRTSKPDSNGFLLELDYLPFGGEPPKFFAPKFSLHYVLYNKFNGAHSNYDGSGRNASDNNTLYLLAWLMF